MASIDARKCAAHFTRTHARSKTDRLFMSKLNRAACSYIIIVDCRRFRLLSPSDGTNGIFTSELSLVLQMVVAKRTICMCFYITLYLTKRIE